MSHLVVLTFNDTEQAGLAFDALKTVQNKGHLRIDDAAVIVKQESGKVELMNQLDKGVKWGAVGGSVLGFLMATTFFPLAGLAIGAIGGALIGRSLDLGVDQKFVKDVTETLKPGSSALFLIGSGRNADVVVAALIPFKGTIYQTTLPTQAVQALLDALKDRE